MAEETAISWADRTWSPWYGCTQVSMGARGACVGCYARFMSETRQKRVVFGGPGRGEGTRDARAEQAWKDPIRWNKKYPGSFVFPSMCDPFDNHPALKELRRRFFDLMRATPNLTWLLLTKRPQNIIKMCEENGGLPPNAAIGCTVVDQKEANRDIPHLLRAKIALNPRFAFLSIEPIGGAIDLRVMDIPVPKNMIEESWAFDALRGRWGIRLRLGSDGSFYDGGRADGPTIDGLQARHIRNPGIDWVISGGETDQGSHRARPHHFDWERSLRDQCDDAGTAFHRKQAGEYIETPEHERADAAVAPTGEWAEGEACWSFIQTHPVHLRVTKVGKNNAPRELDGVLHDERPRLAA